jgi:hypothetical protein
MPVTMTSIRLDTKLADDAVRELGVKNRTEAVHIALCEAVALKKFKKLMIRKGGKLLGKIRGETGCAAGKLRDLHFDVLIALTARGHGARLITSNGSDFRLIRNYCEFALEIW